MTTTAPLTPSASQHASLAEFVDDDLPLVDVVAVAGPPVIFLVVPWVLLALMLAGPFALVVAFAVVLVAAAALVATAAAIVAAPYLLVRHLHRRHQASRAIAVPAPQLVSLRSPRVAA